MRLRINSLVAIMLTAILAVPCAAGAATARTGLPEVAVAFGASYGAVPRTHSGIDVVLEAGATALSAVDGVVTFAGLVPATGGSYRVGAVSVQVPSGHIITLSPLANVVVAKGDPVITGQQVGEVAAAGDASLPDPHLHLSERADGRYIDPTHLLKGWFTTYRDEGSVGEGASQTIVEPHIASPTAARARANSAPSSVPRQPVAGTAGRAVGQSAVALPQTLSSSLHASSLSLMLLREIVSHPAPTLGVKSSTGSPALVANVADRDSAQVPSGLTAAEPRVASWLIDSIGYLGVGLATLAVGLGFALQISSGTEQAVLIHRLGSLFAVRGERW